MPERRHRGTGRYLHSATQHYVRVKMEDGRWSCCAILDERRAVAERLADILRDRYPGHEVVVHTRHEVRTARLQRLAVEQSRLEWEPGVIDAFIREARASKDGAPKAWTRSTAHAARRGLEDLEHAIRTDPRDNDTVARVAGLEPEAVKQIRAGHGTLVISLDMEA